MTLEQQNLKISISNRCQWCQLDYETWNSHSLQYSSCVARNQQTYEFVLQFLEKQTSEVIEKSAISAASASQKQQKLNTSSEDLKAIKKTKTNTVKNAKRVKSKAFKAQEAAKSTPELQNIDIFDSTLTCENRRFSEIANFLQHFQQCQHLYRKSDLLMLLLICLWDFAFDIWYDKQSIMESAFLSEWIEILRVEFVNASFVKLASCSKIICMRCEKSFNFKNKFRNHVRNQHAKKSISSSNLKINAIKSACEIVEKSVVICLLDSSALQKSLVSLATSRKFVSESEMTVEAIISSTSSIFTIATVSNTLQSMKNDSIQCFSASWISFPTLKSEYQEILVRKSATSNQIREFASVFESVISSKCSSLSFFTLEYIPESTKSVSIQRSFDSSELQTPTATSKQIFESALIFETVTSSKISHFSSGAPDTVPELMKNTSTQCSFISSRSSSFQTFESEHHELAIQKSKGKSSLLKISSDKSVCESEKNSVVTNSSASFASLSSIFKRSCSICRIVVISIKKHYLEYLSCHEALRHKLEQQFARRAHQREQKTQKQVELIEQKWKRNSHFSINAVNLVCEIRKTSIASHKLSTSSAKFQRLIFEFTVAFRTITLLKFSDLSSSTLETKLELTEKSATCRRCNQIFNSNNKLHDHIRKHHARKSVKSLSSRASTSELTYKIIEKSASIDSSASFVSQKSFILSTSKSQKFWFSQIASTRSDFPIATYKINSKSMKSAVVVSSLSFSFTSSHSSVRKHQESHIQKFYLIANDLSRMFVEKSRSFDLRQHHNSHFFQQNFDIRQSCSIKSDLTIESLFEMFDEKFRRKSLFQDQNNVFFQSSSDQTRIIVYFKSRVNQKPSISQNSKNSKSKSLNQHMSAESIRIVYSINLSEKSINLLYISADVFCVRNRFLQTLSFSKSKSSKFRISAEISFLIFVFLHFFSVFFFVFAIVSAVSAATMNCINVYEQAISTIDRVIQ